jgi:hypothetical protein
MTTESAAGIATEMLANFMFSSFGWRVLRFARGFFIVPGMEPASMELAEASAPSGPWF